MNRLIIFFAFLLSLLTTVTPAYADPFTDTVILIASYFGETIVAADIYSFIAITALKAAAVAGLSYVAQSLLGQSPSNKPHGVEAQMKTGGEVPQTFIVGKFATAGSPVYWSQWGVDGDLQNAYVTYVLALSDLPVTSLDTFFVNGQQATWNSGLTPTTAWGTPVSNFRVAGKDHLWVKFYDGTQTTADSWLTSTFGSDPDFPYTSGMKGIGRAYVIVTSLWNPTLFAGQFPTFLWALSGIKLYDQRLDSTAGGSGAHRFGTYSTYAFSDNPQVVNNNIFRGIQYNATQWMWGGQSITANHLPSSSWFAGMNVCDTTITDIDSQTVKQYRCGAEISVDMTPLDVIGSLNAASNARIAEIGGYYKVLVGGSGSSVFSFTDKNILIDYDQTFELFPDISTVINAIDGSYPEPVEGWSSKPAPTYSDATALAADGQKRSTTVNYGTVPYVGQVERLMRSAVNESRKFKKHVISLGPEAWPLEPNDVVNYTSTKHTYTSKSFLVAAVTDNANADVLLVLVETDPADYTFNTGTDYLSAPSVDMPITYPSTTPTQNAINKINSILHGVQVILDKYAEIDIRQQYVEEVILKGMRDEIEASITTTRTLAANDTSALADLLTTVRAVADDATAEGIFRITAGTGPAGTAAQAELQVRASEGAGWETARIMLAALVGGGSVVRISADYVEIDGIILTDGGVLTDMLAANAATVHNYEDFTGRGSTNDTVWNDLTTTGITVTCDGFAPIEFDLSLVVDNADNGDHPIQVRLLEDGSAFKSWPSSGTTAFTCQKSGLTATGPTAWHRTPSVGDHTYKYQWRNPSVGTTVLTAEGTMRIDMIKR